MTVARADRREPTLGDRLGAWTFVAASRVLCLFPRRLVLGAARLAGVAAYSLMPGRRRVALDNLRYARPDLDATSRRRIARASFGHAAAMGADLLTLPRVTADVAAHCECRPGDMDRVRALAARGRGVILVAGHFGLMESMGILLGHEGIHVAFVAKPFDNPLLDDAVAVRRGATGNRTIHKGGAKAKALEVLRGGGVVAVVADQHVTWRDRLWIPFFALPAATARSLGTLAFEARSPVVSIHSFPLPGGRCRFEAGLPIEAIDGPEPEATETVVRGAIADLEAAARREPGAWLWLHRRWKVCPDADRARYPFYTITESQERAIAERRRALRAAPGLPE